VVVVAVVVALYGVRDDSMPIPATVREQPDYSMKQLVREAPRETLTATPVATPIPEPIVEPVPVVEPVYAAPVASSWSAPVLQTEIERLVCNKPWPCIEALKVMWCESGGRPDAWNDWENTANPYDGVAGLFQLATGNGQWVGWDLFDPVQNVEAAYIMWSGSGWSHWAWVCRS
jgi:hypothetical protein